MAHILTRDEAIVASALLESFSNVTQSPAQTAFRNLTVEARINAAKHLTNTLNTLLASTSDYFAVEGR